MREGVHPYLHWCLGEVFFFWEEPLCPVLLIQTRKVEEIGAAFFHSGFIFKVMKDDCEEALGS